MSGRGNTSSPRQATTAPALARIVKAAKAFESDVVIPHCSVCTRPCCALTDVVLDLSLREATALYAIEKARPLPAALRRHQGRFFAHGTPCPAYDVGGHRCRVYGTPAKPQGCSDFPIYADGDVVTIDLRCEAVAAHQARLEDALVDALDQGLQLTVSVDPDHPETCVSFGVEDDVDDV